MAVQTGTATIIPKRLARYDFKSDDIQTLEDIQREIENLGRIANESAKQMYRAINSHANVIDDTFDGDGAYKKKISSWNICEDALDSDVLAKEVKKFITNLRWQITIAGFPPTSTLQCGAWPVAGNGTIYWGEKAGQETSLITLGTKTLTAGQTTIAYIDTTDPGTTPAYSVQYKDIATPVTDYPTVLGDGKIILCQARPDGTAHAYRYTLWGGGVWRGN